MFRYAGCLLVVGGWILNSYCLAAVSEEKLFSENTAAIFAKQAQELYQLDPLNSRQVEQSMTLLDAALELDATSVELPELVLRIGASACFTGEDYTSRLSWALERYVDGSSDLEVAGAAVQCMLEHLNSRQDREALLNKLFRKYERESEAFASELATQLGLLAAEKADMKAAIDYLSMAYGLNRYNQLAFIKLQELTAGENLAITPEAYVVQLRTAMDINPYDIAIAGYYADTLLEQQLYEEAERAYDYVSRLYKEAYPDKPLPENVVIPWLTSCYKAPLLEKKCIEIAEQYNKSNPFNLSVEAILGKVIAKAGQPDKAKTILEQAGEKAGQLLQQKDLNRTINPEDLAWFYSFVLDQPEKALAWSNQAYQEAPERQGVSSIFAYTLAQSGQAELAKKTAEPLKNTDQVASLTMAVVYLAGDDKTQAMETLKSTIAMKPYSFVAEKALQLLVNLGSDYVVPLTVDSIRSELKGTFGKQTVPDFLPPSKRIKARLAFGGSEFFYGTDFSPRLLIENAGDSPLVINDAAYLKGNIRVDAFVSGDLNVEIPNLVQRKFRPSKPVMAGEHLSIPLTLQTGKLLKLLRTYPQASVKVEFVVYLDPVEDANKKVSNNLRDIPPVRADVQRPGVALTRDFLMQRLEALTKGQEGQRYRAIELLTGLLAEQKALQGGQASYQHMQVEHALLVDTVRKALLDENWKIRVQTMDSLMTLSIPLEFGMVREMSQNLTHPQWPVRLMSMLVVAKAQPGSFDKVLDWTSQYDPYWLNRRMAIALGAEPARQESGAASSGEDPNSANATTLPK